MTGSEPASLLFRLPLEELETAPAAVGVGKFADLGVLEPKHLESWLEHTPALLGEELLIVTRQFSRFDKSQKRLDLLALDRAGRLVVIEAKRDSSGPEQELQALHYAAYCSTFTLNDVIDEFKGHHGRGKGMSEEEARETLDDFVTEGSLDGFNEDSGTRIILIARSFEPEVTATVLWLIETWGMDIACVELVPYELDPRPRGALLDNDVHPAADKAAEIGRYLRQKVGLNCVRHTYLLCQFDC